MATGPKAEHDAEGASTQVADTLADGTPRVRSHERRAYTDADKAAAMALAALAGVRDAARELQIPERTIYEWCQQGGANFAAMRGWVEARMAGAV